MNRTDKYTRVFVWREVHGASYFKEQGVGQVDIWHEGVVLTPEGARPELISSALAGAWEALAFQRAMAHLSAPPEPPRYRVGTALQLGLMGLLGALPYMPDWIVSNVDERPKEDVYRYRVTGENVNHPKGHPDRRFGWSVPSLSWRFAFVETSHYNGERYPGELAFGKKTS